jgi:Putative zinc-finger
MAELNLLAKILSRAADQKQPKRRWNCPGDGMMAAYVDRALGDADRARLQEHLAGCGYCRTLVADIVKLKRATDVPAAPAALVEKVRALAPSAPRRLTWSWATVAAAGTLACAVIAVTLLKTPQSLTISTPAPAVPVISRPEMPAQSSTPKRETVRNLKSPQSVPAIVLPHPDSVIARERLEFRWNEVPDSLHYQVRLLTSEGDLAWEGDSAATHIRLPDDLALPGGRYFVLVSALMKNGRMRKSTPVAFRVASSE